jgi:PGF-pre-PGF domain-containing protein
MGYTKKIIIMPLLFFVVLLSSQFVSALGLGTLENEFRYTADQMSSIKYLIVKEETDTFFVNLEYIGSLAPYVTFRMDHSWYSTKLDKLDVYLQHEFDLTNLSSATLKFYTKYNIEYGWDFGYVQVSTNNGSSWTQLAGTGTTTYRDGGAYVGFPGSPAYTGVVSSWTQETVNLTPYVGNNILLRFRYITDWYYAERGWFIDDISIEELGFFDDVEYGSGNWSTDEWLYNVLHVNESGKLFPFYIDFLIPNNYQYNGTGEKIKMEKIPGLEEDFNPGQSSSPTIIVRMPPIVKILPSAPPPSPGGGGGAGGASHYLRYSAGVVSYFIQRSAADTVYSFSITQHDSPVRRISILLNSIVRDAVVHFTPLDAKPSNIKQELPNVYRYFEVSTVNIYNDMIDNATLKVEVPRDWINAQGIEPEDMVVTRFFKGEWSDLETVLVDEDETNYYYEAITPGFSVFAIRVKEPIGPPAIIEPVPTVKPNISQVKPVTIITGNESVEDVIDEIKRQLLQKANATEEEKAEVLGPSYEAPEKKTSSLWEVVKVVLALIILIAIKIAIVLVRTRKKRLGRFWKKISEKIKKRTTK